MQLEDRYRHHFDFRDPTVFDDFWDVLAAMRSECPVARSDQYGGFWVVTSYDEVQEVLHDPATFRSGEGVTLPRVEGTMRLPPIETDPPEQKEWRRLLNPYFSPAAVNRHGDAIRAAANEFIDRFIDRGECDIVDDFANPFPGTVFFRHIMEIDPADLDHVLGLTHTIAFRRDDPSMPAAFMALAEYCNRLLDRRAAGESLGGDVTGAVLAGTIGGDPIPRDRQVAALMMVIIGGLDTSSSLISNICKHLCQHPDTAKWLATNPSEIPLALEEFLRLEPSVVGLFRQATRDVVLGGRQISEGDWVLVYFGGANHDPKYFDRPDELVFDRAANRHLAFGLGAHRCMGSNLARLEISIAIEELLSRIEDMALKPGTTLHYHGAFGRAGVRSLPITFTARQPASTPA